MSRSPHELSHNVLRLNLWLGRIFDTSLLVNLFWRCFGKSIILLLASGGLNLLPVLSLDVARKKLAYVHIKNIHIAIIYILNYIHMYLLHLYIYAIIIILCIIQLIRF